MKIKSDIKSKMVNDMVNELNCWDTHALVKKAKVVYRKELAELPLQDLLHKYNELTFHCLEDGRPMP